VFLMDVIFLPIIFKDLINLSFTRRGADMFTCRIEEEVLP
jgi:hypothetical protein